MHVDSLPLFSMQPGDFMTQDQKYGWTYAIGYAIIALALIELYLWG